MSCLALSSHLYLGFPCGLLVRGFHLNIFLTVLVSGILCTWPNQLSLWALIWLTTFVWFIGLSNSSLVLILHIWFSFVGPFIHFTIFSPLIIDENRFYENGASRELVLVGSLTDRRRAPRHAVGCWALKTTCDSYLHHLNFNILSTDSVQVLILRSRHLFNPQNAELNPSAIFWHYWALTIFSTLAV